MIEHEPARWKMELVDSVVKGIEKSPVVGLVSISNVPGPQLQSMRARLRDHLTIQVIKNNLLEIALRKAAEKRKGVDQLTQEIEGQTALLLSDFNPFKLHMLLEKTKTKRPAKGGETSPIDIEIKAGETSFKPGPIIGELQKAGIPAAIEKGKVVIKKDKIVVKQGEEISRALALALTKLEIYPLTVGLELKAAYEAGTIFHRETLAIDSVAYIERIQKGARSALNLSVFAAIPHRLSIAALLNKAHTEAINLAVCSEYPATEVLKILITIARSQSLALASHLSADAMDEDARSPLAEGTAADRRPEIEGKEQKSEKEEKKKEEKKASKQ